MNQLSICMFVLVFADIVLLKKELDVDAEPKRILLRQAYFITSIYHAQ